jgi:queuine tRNA-ribosyltransferase
MAPMPFEFTLLARDPSSRARAGVFSTPHGELATPVFAPVGTQATVKAIAPRELRALGATLVLANAYHLYLRPGAERIARLGGLHRFMGWDGPLLTDSGGYQIFSLEQLRAVDDDGVTFRSHLDGSLHRFTPETVMAIEEQLGADIAMTLDECPPPLERAAVEGALRRTHAWAERCRRAHSRADQALFGIVQGGVFADLRERSAAFITGLDFPGYAIGGLSVGESRAERAAVLAQLDGLLPADRPRYLMGVGDPADFFEAVARGVDIFDCVLPTRLARHGAALTSRGRLNLLNARWADEPGPLDPACGCYTCEHFALAYLRHLFKAGEILGLQLATVHNLHYLLDLMRRIRAAVLDGTFAQLAARFRQQAEAQAKEAADEAADEPADEATDEPADEATDEPASGPARATGA